MVLIVYFHQFVPVKPQIDAAGLQNMLEYLKQKYGDPSIYVEENGLQFIIIFICVPYFNFT